MTKQYEVLFSREQLAARVAELGAELRRDYAGKTPLVLGVLKGAVFFFADLLRAAELPCKIGFLTASSYLHSTESSGEVTVKMPNADEIRGQDVILVEDILDTGNTLYKLTRLLREQGANSVKTIVLLDKPDRRTADFSADYVGFTIPDAFVVGYGLDFDEQYRYLPDVVVLPQDTGK